MPRSTVVAGVWPVLRASDSRIVGWPPSACWALAWEMAAANLFVEKKLVLGLLPGEVLG